MALLLRIFDDGELFMPVIKCPNGRYRIGKGKCIYKTKEAAEKAYKAYLAKKHSKGGKK